MTDASLTGYSHVSLSVTDLERSKAWYCDVLGFTVLERNTEEEFDEWILLHPSGAVLCLQAHHANDGEHFVPRRTGLDHLGFKVERRAELDAWARRFAEAGVKHSPVVDRDYGAVLCFRDPDDIQLEVFYREGHP